MGRRLASWMIVAMAMAAAGSWGCARQISQPLAFDHRLHADNNVPCRTCHPTATTGQGATLPAVAVCRRCHEDVLYESREEVKIRKAAEAGRELGWVPVFALRPYVFFSHRRHVTLGRVACAACHGDVERRDAPFQQAASPFAGIGGMRACLRCHDESHSPYAGVDCVDCHR